MTFQSAYKAAIKALTLAGIGSVLTGCFSPGPGGFAPQPLDPLQSLFAVGVQQQPVTFGTPVTGMVPPTPIIAPQGHTASGPASIQAYLDQPSLLSPAVLNDALVDQVTTLYRRNQMQPLWHDGTEWLPAALETAQVLANARVHGLEPSDYLPARQALPHYGLSNPAAIVQAEIELTSGVLRYIVDVKEGRYAPTQRINPVAEFLAGAQSNDYGGWLAGLGVHNWVYRRLVNASGQHQQLFGPAWDRYRVTMERLRWDAPDLPTTGRYVLLNVGSAEVWAMNGLQLDLGANAVVGRSTRRTPLNNDSISSLKFSPDWTAPYSIVEKDLVKFAREDPSFVDLMGVEIFRGGQKIDPNSIDWQTINVRNYVFKQPPGPANVLGGVRFTLQNSGSIYMHDSPDKGLFDDAFRAKSSGCIRVGASDEFALWLLQGEDSSWTIDQVRDRMSKTTSSFESLEQSVPVRTIYTTAWVSHNGTLTTSPDVYGENQDLRRRMGLPIETVDDFGLSKPTELGDVF